MQMIRMLLNADSYVDVDANGDDTINQLINQSISHSQQIYIRPYEYAARRAPTGDYRWSVRSSRSL